MGLILKDSNLYIQQNNISEKILLHAISPFVSATTGVDEGGVEQVDEKKCQKRTR